MSELLESLKEILAISGLGLILAAGTYAFAKHLNETLGDDVKLRVSLWFIGDAPKFEWHSHLMSFFNGFFGDKYFSWKCFCRLGIVTITTWILWLLLLLYIGGGLERRDLPDSILTILAVTFAFYYLMVLKTRLALSLNKRFSQSLHAIGLTIFIDLFTNPGIVAACLTLWVELDGKGFGCGAVGPLLIVTMLFSLPTTIHSIWLLIYFAATIVAKFATWLSMTVPPLGKILSQKRIERKPITLIGELAAAIILVAFLGIGLVSASSGHHVEGATQATDRRSGSGCGPTLQALAQPGLR